MTKYISPELYIFDRLPRELQVALRQCDNNYLSGSVINFIKTGTFTYAEVLQQLRTECTVRP